VLTVTQIDYIKHLREVEGASISEIATRVECSWKTAKKYADGSIDLQGKPKQKRKRRVMEGYEEWIEAMLEEDQRMPRKQRRTAKKIYEALVEIGYQGSDRTVREYVRRMKQNQQERRQQQAIRLEHRPGEAQVDFSEFQAINGTQVKTYHELVVSFPYSNAQFCRVLPAENSVCFFHGLQSIIEEMGGTPTVMRFDNMSPIVAKILSGTDRVLTEMFKTFQWHYRFQAEICNPGKGNEKGSVENKVGYVRRNSFTPMPVIKDLEKFNREVAEKMRQDRERIHYRKGVLISELWQDDAARLLALPHAPLEIVQVRTRVVNKYGEIKLDEHVYRVPNVPPRSRVLVKAYWDRLEIVDEYGEKLLHTCPRFYLQKAKNIDWAAELEIFIQRPRAVERAVYLKALPDSIREYFLSTRHLGERRNRISAMVDVLGQYPLEVAERAAANSLRYGKTDGASLRTFAAYEAGVLNPDPLPFKEPWTPSEVAQWQPDLSAYDLLGVVNLR
jgi:transposase